VVTARTKRRSLERPEIGLFGLIKQWLVSSFRKIDGAELPDEGRSSVESNDGSFGALSFGSVVPPFDLQVLTHLKKLWICNPDFSQYVSNAESLGNTGHTLTVDAASDSQAEAALSRINESAARIYENGAGVDGLMNAYLDQLAWSGALSSEDVVDFGARRVDKVVLVPVEQIRFRYIDGSYIAHQQPNTFAGFARSKSPLGLIPLNPATYHYYAIQTIENSPYAKPPATAAVDLMLGPQQDAIDNIKWIVQKLGILGLVAFLVKKPTVNAGEDSASFKKRAEQYLADTKKKLDGHFNKGLLVGFKGEHDINHANVASDGRGSKEIFQVIEELVFSGIGSMAAFHGRNYTTTETFADVIYSILAAQVVNRQRLVKRRQEKTNRLDLRLAGIQIDGASLQFNRVEARNELQKAQAEQIRQAVVLERARAGIISPDQAAQELGYESAFDPELLSANPAVAKELRAKIRANTQGFSATYRFDRAAQRYRFVSSTIEIAGAPDDAAPENVLKLLKKKAA
jgi:hypothetical protein